MNYQLTALKKVFSVSKIATVHYFEYEKDFFFVGEQHDFWEIIYVDKGKIEIARDQEWFLLEQGQAVFYQPNEYHNLRANGIDAPNLVIITFQCRSASMEFFKRKTFPLSDFEKHLLAQIVFEAKQAFSSPLEDTFLSKLERRKDAPFGAEQMLLLSLEQLLISLYRSYGEVPFVTSTLRRGLEQDVVADVLRYLQENIQEKLVFQQVLNRIGISGSSLKVIFKEKMGMGVMQYFSKMKMEAAKTLIREGNLNISQIAGYLGFDSIHLFSRRFRQMTGMSPTEYGKSVKVEFEHLSKR